MNRRFKIILQVNDSNIYDIKEELFIQKFSSNLFYIIIQRNYPSLWMKEWFGRPSELNRELSRLVNPEEFSVLVNETN